MSPNYGRSSGPKLLSCNALQDCDFYDTVSIRDAIAELCHRLTASRNQRNGIGDHNR